jgi:uncharacterized protein (DUF2062 family)
VALSFSEILRLHDTPSRTAVAFAVGVFFSFSPLLGLQIVLAMTLAFLFGLNRLAVFVGLNANLPWLVVPWYTGTTLAAATLMDIPLPADFRREISVLFSRGMLSRDFWTHAAGMLRPFLIPFLVGPTIGAALIGLAAYPPVFRMLRARARLESE